jgi:hypothetical protein
VKPFITFFSVLVAELSQNGTLRPISPSIDECRNRADGRRRYSRDAIAVFFPSNLRP